jgi:basic membrane protein A
MLSVAPDVALTSATNNWTPYVTYAVKCVINGEPIVTDWSRGYVDGAVAITELNPLAVAPGTAEKVDEVVAGLADGSIKVFDVSTFTVPASTDGSYKIDENGHLISAYSQDTNGDWVYDTAEIIKDGAYAEGSLISAPSFNLIIDGITLK